jgi:hypothetical protein
MCGTALIVAAFPLLPGIVDDSALCRAHFEHAPPAMVCSPHAHFRCKMPQTGAVSDVLAFIAD